MAGPGAAHPARTSPVAVRPAHDRLPVAAPGRPDVDRRPGAGRSAAEFRPVRRRRRACPARRPRPVGPRADHRPLSQPVGRDTDHGEPVGSRARHGEPVGPDTRHGEPVGPRARHGARHGAHREPGTPDGPAGAGTGSGARRYTRPAAEHDERRPVARGSPAVQRAGHPGGADALARSLRTGPARGHHGPTGQRPARRQRRRPGRRLRCRRLRCRHLGPAGRLGTDQRRAVRSHRHPAALARRPAGRSSTRHGTTEQQLTSIAARSPAPAATGRTRTPDRATGTGRHSPAWAVQRVALVRRATPSSRAGGAQPTGAGPPHGSGRLVG
ncbi:hypothetical protein SAMN05443287_107234 [Micromonospora phaseoli]|uniref:Uncharacterized protein n=1 Tax=Micromonospora phaseoli TaxID=1144548 RepID=A0A1H7BH49_9ACTN|nr:hypothetical protein SAMN05443287_107234 [Micromonospora phaseoli]